MLLPFGSFPLQHFDVALVSFVTLAVVAGLFTAAAAARECKSELILGIIKRR